jgi:ribosomal protein L37AE/L43A
MDAQHESALSEISCPKCGSADVRRSRSEGFLAAFLRVFGRWPFRCRSCRARFYRAAEPPEEF